MLMRIAVLILTYNRKDLLIRCLNSIKRASKQPDEIIIIDNKSTDGTREYLKNNLSDKTLIFNDNNSLGVCARNLGIKNTSCDIIFQVDDDAQVNTNWREIIEKYFADDKVGAIGQDAWKLTGWFSTQAVTKTGQLCDLVTGYLWAFRKKDKWFYDEAYAPFWREDTDFCFHIINDSYKIIKCEALGSHASARKSIDWSIHDKNTAYLINKWKNKLCIQL